MTGNSKQGSGVLRDFGFVMGILLVALVIFYYRSFDPDMALFINDSPLSFLSAACVNSASNLKGQWMDLYFLGNALPANSPNLDYGLFVLLGPLGYTKFGGPLSLLFLGLCAWVFFRQLGFNRLICVLGALAVMLNMSTFSTSCWGLNNWVRARGFVFLAMAALVSATHSRPLLKVILAGLLLGLNVMEGFDLGALYSLLVAAFAVFLALQEQKRPLPNNVIRGILRVALMAGFAAFMAAHTLNTLVTTQMKGMAGATDNALSAEQKWDFATQWSLPKAEALRVIIPGLFGYRLDTADGGNYWGTVGQQPGYEQHHQGFQRHSGTGEYAGVLVVLIALWALAQSLRKKKEVFSEFERRLIWFWGIVGLVCLLLAFGRHAPFYQFIYPLPFFSQIRNPIKFMHFVHLALVILFAYGLQGLWRCYVVPEKGVAPAGRQPGGLWANAMKADAGTVWALLGVVVVSLLGWLVYAASRQDLEKFIFKAGFPDARLAEQMARFSINEVMWFVVFLAVAAGLIIMVVGGFFAGKRQWALAALLGAYLVVDLGRADFWWVKYYNYKERLSSNAVLDILRRQGYLYRTAFLPLSVPPNHPLYSKAYNLQRLYQIEWLQHQFLYYNIPSTDFAQMPRMAEDYYAWRTNFGSINALARSWQLMSTRYLLALSGFAESLNSQLDPVKRRFRVHTTFEIVPRKDTNAPLEVIAPEDLTVVSPGQPGDCALIEFTGALPRAGLYSRWEIPADNSAALKRLLDPAFEPETTVLVSNPTPEMAGMTNFPAGPVSAGAVQFVYYSPKYIKLDANVHAPAVLMLNDKIHDDWKVWVDGQPAQMLRCNYIMRGVFLKPGRYTVEFRYVPEARSLYVSVAALAILLVLSLYLGLVARMRPAVSIVTAGPGTPAGK